MCALALYMAFWPLAESGGLALFCERILLDKLVKNKDMLGFVPQPNAAIQRRGFLRPLKLHCYTIIRHPVVWLDSMGCRLNLMEYNQI